MAATLQTQTIQAINNIILAANQFSAAKALIDQVSATYTQLTLGTVIAALATTAVGADGSLGTADVSPNVAHTIDPRVYAALPLPLGRAISSNDVGSLLTGLQAVSLLLAGSAAAQQGQLPQILAKVSGG